MRKILTFVLAMRAVGGLAEDPAIPTRRILPPDVMAGSVQTVALGTNGFMVRWTYTPAGANNMLAFNEAYEHQKTRLVVGAYEILFPASRFQPMPPLFTNYTQWKTGWLKHRGDKLIGVSEADAKKIVAGLKGE